MHKEDQDFTGITIEEIRKGLSIFFDEAFMRRAEEIIKKKNESPIPKS